MAPGWMAMLKTAHSSALKPSSSVARIRWPVEETGRYSVTPSTMPRMMTSQRIGTLAGGRQVDVSAAELAAAVESAQPFPAHRCQRRRFDSKCFQALRALVGQIVMLEHEPLITGQRGPREEAEQRQQTAGKIGKLDQFRV